MMLPCGCVDICKGHAAQSSAPLSVRPGEIHAPSLLEAAARFCTGLIERKAGMPEGRIYNNGLGHFVKAAVQQHPGIPQTPLTAGDLLRRAGIIPERENPTRKKRSVR